MKKNMIVASLLLATVAMSAANAGGYYRSSHSNDHSIGNGIVELVKFPFRLVAGTTYGVVDLLAHGETDGFEEGYKALD